MQRTSHSTRTLPATPDLDQLRRQAKELLEAFKAGESRASAEVHTHYRDAVLDAFALHDAQLVLARAYGFDSWPKLKAHVDGINAKAFIRAAADNNLAQVEAVLKARPDLVNAQWSYGDERRAIHQAVMKRSADMVRLLMRHGADPRVGDLPTTAYEMAVERDYTEIVSIIEEEQAARKAAAASAPTGTPPAVETPRKPPIDVDVLKAVARGDVPWLRARHAERPLVNVVHWEHGGLLTLAAVNNRADALAFLLDIGFDPDELVRWSEGPDAAYSAGYPLWHCASTGKQPLAELLLQRGANPNVHVDSSGSSVYAAYSHKQWAMIPLLQKYGGVVTPDIVGLYRETELAKQLLAGTVVLPDNTVPDGRTPEDYLLEFALSGGAAEIVRLTLPRIGWAWDDERWFRMLQRGLDFWNHLPSLYASNRSLDRESYLEAFRLLAAHCDPNVTGGRGQSALHEVSAVTDHLTDDERASLTRILLDAGAHTNVRDGLFNSTPLGWACRWGRISVARVLLERGADPVERDAEPWATPRAWAEKKKRGELLALLREHGA